MIKKISRLKYIQNFINNINIDIMDVISDIYNYIDSFFKEELSKYAYLDNKTSKSFDIKCISEIHPIIFSDNYINITVNNEDIDNNIDENTKLSIIEYLIFKQIKRKKILLN